MIMMDVFVSVFLFCESIEDIKTQKLDVLRLTLFGSIAIALEFLFMKSNCIEMLTGAAFGIISLGIAWVTKEAIGYGDGVVMVIVGICCGLGRTLQIFILAIIVMIFMSIAIMIKKGVRFDYKIPFIPCLFIGYLGGLLL